MIRLIVTVLLACALVVPTPAAAQSKKALKLLSQLRQVDGSGSGLDADTVRGMTPDQLKAVQSGDANTLNGQTAQQIVAQARDANTLRGLAPLDIVTQNIAAAIAYAATQGYGRSASTSLASGFCDCASVFCDDGNDFRINCGGGFVPFPATSGILTANGAIPNTFNGCGACGCNDGFTSMTLSAEIICLRVP